jgi:hypothetical protein
MTRKNIYKPIEEEDWVDRLFREKFGYRDFVRCDECGTTPCCGDCMRRANEARTNLALLGALAVVIILIWWVLSGNVTTVETVDVPGYVTPKCARCER